MKPSGKPARQSQSLLLLLTLASTCSLARAEEKASTPPAAPAAEARSIEDLNLVGAEAAMPPFSESVLDEQGAFRRTLASRGVALRLIQQVKYAQNLLQEPVSTGRQVYVGDAPFGSALEHAILTADLRQLHLRHAQLYLSGDWNWASWRPAGPKTFQLWGLYLYKAFAGDRLQIKAGYVSNNMEFVGLFVGGSTATAAQGVYAVLPYELGLSYFPLTSPSFNLRLRGPRNSYLKAAAERSLDAAGGPASVARNHTGFRFAPKGDKLLTIGEAGWARPAAADSRMSWFRAGFLHNSTAYKNLQNGRKESGNQSAFVLMDYQLRQPDPRAPAHGLYLGGSAMTAASRFNPYDRYYEARLYQMAPFRSRPADMASLVSSYTSHSRFATNALLAAGRSVWRNSASVTGSYSLRAARGHFVSLGLSYIHGPAITPRVDDTMTFTTSYTVFF